MARLTKTAVNPSGATKSTPGTATLQQSMGLFDPAYMAGQRKNILASVGQSAVGAGLSGTTRPGAVSAGMIANLESERRSKLAGIMGNLAQMQSAEQMEAGRLDLSKAALALEQAKAKQTMRFQREGAKKPGGVLSDLPRAPQGYKWGGAGLGARYAGKPRLSSMFSQTRSGFQRF